VVHLPVGVERSFYAPRPIQCLVKWAPGAPLHWVVRQPGHVAVPGAKV
jgi:hypothetical protein